MELAWTRIFGKLAQASTLDAMSVMFRDEDYFENRCFPIFHKIVLELSGADLETQLKLSTKSINDVDYDGRTALSWAAARGDTKAVEHLLNYGADPNIPSNEGRMPIHWAAQSNCPETLEPLLVHKADLRFIDIWKRTPLMYASCNHNNNKKYLEVLLEAGDSINSRDRFLRTALGHAAKMNRFHSVAFLLEQGADAELADEWGMTPLFETIKPSHHESLRSILERSDDFTGFTTYNQTLLHLLAAQGNIETVTLFKDKDLSGIDPQIQDKHGFTAAELLSARADLSDHEKDEIMALFPKIPQFESTG